MVNQMRSTIGVGAFVSILLWYDCQELMTFYREMCCWWRFLAAAAAAVVGTEMRMSSINSDVDLYRRLQLDSTTHPDSWILDRMRRLSRLTATTGLSCIWSPNGIVVS